MTSMKIVQFSTLPTLLVLPRSKLFRPHDLGRPTSNERPPLQMITNQFKENTIQE